VRFAERIEFCATVWFRCRVARDNPEKCVREVSYKIMKRMLDVFLSGIIILLLCVPMLIIAMMVKLTSKGPVLHWSKRIGKDNVAFRMPKFRTMHIDAPDLATHLMENPSQYLTPFGRFLRKLSLDELPQAWAVLKGDMTFVGPRPALYNQEDLIELRTKKGLHRLMPGITGWAQVNGRDNITVSQKVECDEYYMNHQSFIFDLKIIFLTPGKVIKAEGINC
jgi:O-antigen biosynthesis protein WbqP